MVRSYLRYREEGRRVMGVVCSADSAHSIAYDEREGVAVVPALSKVALWKMRHGSLVRTFHSEDVDTSGVVVTQLSPDGAHVFAGYADGVIRAWNRASGACDKTLSGHRSRVSCIAFGRAGTLLVSGSDDTTVIVWDLLQDRGLFRLKGHKAPITCCRYLEKSNAIITSSKDTHVKVWDVDTQHCVQTVVGHRAEVWSLAVDSEEARMFTGSVDPNIRVWRLLYEEGAEESEARSGRLPVPTVELLGFVPRSSTERVLQVSLSPSGGTLGVLGKDKFLELFAVFSEEEAARRTKKRVARLVRKRRQKAGMAEAAEDDVLKLTTEEERAQIAADLLVPQQKVVAPALVRSFAFARTAAVPHVLLGLADNRLLLVALSPDTSQELATVALPAHPSDVRSLALSADASLLLSTSNHSARLWNAHTSACVSVVHDTGYALCSLFAPGDRYVLLGTKSGHIDIVMAASGEIVAQVEAHSEAVWSMALLPGDAGIVSGGADKTLKFWNFDLQKLQGSSKRTLSLVLTQTVVMEDDVLAITISRDSKFLAVALLDNTVKVFFADSMKFFLSLYGHKLPVLSLDISADSLLLITASADKNVKIWGLDFGECRRSLFAHNDSVMQVKFVGDTHLFFSAGKDNAIKYWDADKHKLIHTLDGHHGEVWCLAISKDGKALFSGSHDRSVRVWRQTHEQVFIDEEEEMRMDKMFESEMQKKGDEEDFAPGEMELECAMAGRRDLESVKAGERIIEALEMVEAEEQNVSGYETALAKLRASLSPHEVKQLDDSDGWDERLPPPQPSAFLRGKSPSDFLLEIVVAIRPDVLEQALLLLNFSTTVMFMRHLLRWVQEEKRVEMSCRCLFQLLQQHHNQIIASASTRDLLLRLQETVRPVLRKSKDMMGMNLAALSYLKRDMQANSKAQLFRMADKIERIKERDRMRAEQPRASKRRKKR